MPVKTIVLIILPQLNYFRRCLFSKTMQEKFQRALTSFSCAGKKVFSLEELFELRSNIKEREKLHIKSEGGFRIRIESCEFENLRIHSPALIKLLTNLQISPDILILLGISDDNFFNKASSVLISKIGGRFGNNDSVEWQFNSNHAHIDNSIKAVMKGMGCPLQLKTIFATNLSDGIGSLARASITLIDRKPEPGRTYHGLWVSQSIIIGIAQATVEAVSSWIFEMLPHGDEDEFKSHFQSFKQVCCEFSELDRNIRNQLNLVNNYGLHNPEIPSESLYASSPERSILDLEADIQKLRDTINKICIAYEPLSRVYRQYDEEMDIQESLLIWMKMRLCRNKWDLENLKDCLNKTKDVSAPIEVLYESERITFKFINGDEEFLLGKLWREGRLSILNKSLSNLQDFSDNFDPNYRIHNDLTYIATSEILGTVSRLDLYFCDRNDKSILNDAAQRFMMASHFACKIGLRQKSARWLAFASRCYTRLGNSQRSRDCIDAALEILVPIIEPRYDIRYKDAILAGINLAQGELALLANEHQKAGQFFSNALAGALYVGFTRLSSDCLYGLSRVHGQIEPNSLDKLKNFVVTFKEGNHGSYVKELLVQLLEYLNPSGVKDERDPQSFFKYLARNSVWNHGRTPDDRPHPIANAIGSGSFLSIMR